MPDLGPEDQLALRATTVFEGWLERQSRGQAEPFEELAQAHPQLRPSLERLRRMDGVLREAMAHTVQDPISADSRKKMLGDFKIRHEIGRGAMGIVFEAEQMSLRRKVALKVLPAHLTLDARALARFKREAEISAKLNHRNVIDIHQVGEVAGVHYIAMELVEGTSLDRVIERMRRESFESVRKQRIGDIVSVQGLEDENALPGMPPASEGQRPSTKRGSSSASDKNYIETAVKLIRRVADALQHAHEAGIIHRDIKPSNILVRPDGSPVLTDFGLAREEGLPSVSMTGDFAGTPHYVSPEQAMSGRVPVDQRADVFSLGATLYELLTLEVPFPGENIHEVLSRIISKPPRDPLKLNPALAPDLVTIVLKALEKDPDRRYQSAAELGDDLRAFIEYRPIHARRTPTVVRAWRWVKREPLKAVLAGVLVLGGPAVVALVRDRMALQGIVAASTPDRIEGDLKQGFLDLGLRRYPEAERTFDAMLAGPLTPDTSLEALAGLTFALLEQERAPEALERLEAFKVPESLASVVERLRAEALREDGQEREARRIEEGLPVPRTAVGEYVAGMRLLRGMSLDREAGKDSILQRRERAAQAVQLLGSAALTSDRALYYFALAGAAKMAEDPVEARRIAGTIPRKWKDEALAWFYVGIASEVFDAEAALEAYARAIELDPDLQDAERQRGILLIDRDPERGLETLAQLVEQRSDPTDAGPLVDQAAAFYQVGRFEEAAATARQAVELAPTAVEALDTLGSASYALGRYEEAREALERALELEPTGARLHNDLALALRALGETDAAREHLERAAELAPADPLPLSNLAWLHLENGARARARPLFQQALQRFEERPSRDVKEDMLWKGIGLSYPPEEQRIEALEAFEEAWRLAPEDPGHALNLGSALLARGRFSEAVERLEQALAAGLGDHSAHEGLVRALQELGDWPATLRAARRWSAACPDSAAAWNDRAWPQVDPDGDPALRDAEDGLRSARRAVELSGGQDAGLRDTLAWALFWAGHPDEALDEGHAALELARQAQPGLVGALQASLERLEQAAAVSSR